MSIEVQPVTHLELQGQQVPDEGGPKTTQIITKHSKSNLVAKLLRRAKGATLAELQEVTAWQPHSVRAFLSGLRKKGSPVAKEQRKSGETAYRLSGNSLAHEVTDA